MLVFVDLDGTLLTQNKKFNPETINFIKNTKDKIKYILTSSNSYREMEEYSKTLGINEELISFGGAFVNLPFDAGKWLYNSLITKEQINEIFGIYKPHILTAFYKRDKYLYRYRPIDKLKYFYDVSEEFIKDELFFERDIYSMFLVIDVDVYDDFCQRIDTNYKNIKVELYGKDLKYSICFLKPKCDKASAVDIILNYYNETLENAYAFGDSANDLPLLNKIPNFYAMKNSDKDLLSKAKNITEFDNNNNGVIIEIEKIIKEKAHID